MLLLEMPVWPKIKLFKKNQIKTKKSSQHNNDSLTRQKRHHNIKYVRYYTGLQSWGQLF